MDSLLDGQSCGSSYCTEYVTSNDIIIPQESRKPAKRDIAFSDPVESTGDGDSFLEYAINQDSFSLQ